MEYNGTVHPLFKHFEKAYSVWREVLYNIFTEFGIPVEQVGFLDFRLFTENINIKHKI